MKTIVPPASEVVTLEEFAEHLKIGGSPYPEQLALENALVGAREWVEKYVRRAIGEQTLEDYFPAFKTPMYLRPPVHSVVSVYYHTGGVKTLLDPLLYELIDDGDRSYLLPNYNVVWPTTDLKLNAVEIRYVAGYTTGSPNTMPRSITNAILLIAADLYENREAQTDRELYTNKAAERCLSMFRLDMGI